MGQELTVSKIAPELCFHAAPMPFVTRIRLLELHEPREIHCSVEHCCYNKVVYERYIPIYKYLPQRLLTQATIFHFIPRKTILIRHISHPD